jgi:purine-binding chemotaxis protein CheW
VVNSSDPFTDSETGTSTEIVVFVLEERDFALKLSVVDRVFRMAEAMPLPGAPVVVRGIVDVAGELVPLLDIRQRFRMPARSARSSDSLIVARTRARRVALPVDAVVGLVSVESSTITRPDEIVSGLEFIAGITRVPGRDLVLIHDLDRFLSLDEEQALTAALDHAR